MHPDHIPGHLPDRPKLEDYDNEVWDLTTYLRCLENMDILNECFECVQRDLADDYGNNKHHLRYGGLEILRDVNNRD